MRLYILLIFTICNLIFSASTLAQNLATLSGKVIDKTTQLPLSAASIIINPGNKGVVTDSLGKFRITNITTGSYSLTVSVLGYETQTRYNIIITTGNEQALTFELENKATLLSGILVSGRKRTARAASIETPLSVQRLTTEEIKSNPGGNFDISRVIQSLPGVGGTAGSVGGFRNDIIIRGGAPNENVYYLDGIEVPTINHFSTQGSAGGPTGILNVSFIEDVKLSSSAFDARYDNALSSVFQFKQKNGNTNRTQGNIRLSATELAATLEGPLSKSKGITYLASARRSYLQLLFSLIDLPIRPNYWDFQTKILYPINKKTTLTFLGVAAIDDFVTTSPKNATPEKLYVINANPIIQQKSYTVGFALKHIINKGYWNLTLSRNYLNNDLDKFEDNNNPIENERVLDIRTKEIENKLRIDVNQTLNGWKFAYGAMAQLVGYDNKTYNVVRKKLTDENGNIVQPATTVYFTSPLQPFLKFGLFSQASKRFANDRLGISAGIRMDGNSFTENGGNLLNTFSPRISFSYVLADKWTANVSIGRYYKIPTNTILGYANNNNVAVNKNAKYLRNNHYVAGIEFLPSDATRFTLEGFFKKYSNVAVSVRDGISLSNLGADFNVLGNEAVTTSGNGQAYGLEFFAQQKLTKHFFGIISYTYFRSKYSGVNNQLIASNWDNQHILALTFGYKLPRNWEFGLKFRYQGGAPYSPFDAAASRLNYLSQGTGTLNYTELNNLRLRAFNASDIRIDKKWNYKHLTIDVFVDITNWYGAASPAYPQYTFKRNTTNTDFVTTDNKPIKPDGSNAIPIILKNDEASTIPTIGFIVEF